MGRTSILMVMGFNIIFVLIGNNLRSISSQAYKNYSNYYNVEKARFITESAANLATGQLSADTSYIPPSTSVSLWEGSYQILKKCKIINEVEYIEFTIPATYGGIKDTTKILATKMRFSEYAMYSVNENGIYWKDGEVCNGPLYTNSTLRIDGSPIFNGPVTAVGGWTGDASASPIFNNVYKRGPVVTLPGDLGTFKADAVAAGKKYTVNTYVDFKSDGTVIVRTSSYSGPQVAGSPFASPAALAANGALLVEGANLHIKGVLNGKITACAMKSGWTGGNVYIDSSMTYATPPLNADGTTNYDCDDMLGIVADKDVILDDNTSNPASMTIHGSIMCRTGGLVAENYDDTRRIGVLSIVGGIQQLDRKGVGTFNSSTGAQLHGFSKNYSYDERLATKSPPSYPESQRYRIISWYDKVNWDASLWD